MNPPLRYRYCELSHPGNVRKLNEDTSFASGERGIFCVADGMGGYQSGDKASAAVTGAVASVIPAEDLNATTQRISEAISEINTELIQQRSHNGEAGMMGSTVVVLITADDQCACLWAGDSRLYLHRDHCLFQMSKDHSVVEELVDSGVIEPHEAATHPQSHMITRAVGADLQLDLDRIFFELRRGDVLLLCSDGLYSELSADEIAQVLSQSGDCQEKASSLMQKALQGRASDNVTVSIVDVI